MKRIFFTLTIIFSLSFLLFENTMARELTVYNGTPLAFQSFSISDTNENNQANILNNTLKSGEGLVLDIAGGDDGWDITVVLEDKTSIVYKNLNFTGINALKLNQDSSIEILQ